MPDSGSSFRIFDESYLGKGMSVSEVLMILACVILTQYQHVTDGRMHISTIASTVLARYPKTCSFTRLHGCISEQHRSIMLQRSDTLLKLKVAETSELYLFYVTLF